MPQKRYTIIVGSDYAIHSLIYTYFYQTTEIKIKEQADWPLYKHLYFKCKAGYIRYQFTHKPICYIRLSYWRYGQSTVISHRPTASSKKGSLSYTYAGTSRGTGRIMEPLERNRDVGFGNEWLIDSISSFVLFIDHFLKIIVFIKKWTLLISFIMRRVTSRLFYIDSV